MSKARPFDGFDLTDFWEDSDYARDEYVEPQPSDEMIASIEAELGYKLPSAYIALCRFQNGGIAARGSFRTNKRTSWAEDHVAIHGIGAIGRKKSWSLCGQLGSKFHIDEWEYPPIGVYFGDCPSAGHDLIALDYRECGTSGEPSVVHVDQELDYEITYLAPNFESFIRGLESEEAFPIDPEIIAQAVAGAKVNFNNLGPNISDKVGPELKRPWWRFW